MNSRSCGSAGREVLLGFAHEALGLVDLPLLCEHPSQLGL